MTSTGGTYKGVLGCAAFCSSSAGQSYEVDLTWTGSDGDEHHGVMTTCNRPDEGEHVTV